LAISDCWYCAWHPAMQVFAGVPTTEPESAEARGALGVSSPPRRDFCRSGGCIPTGCIPFCHSSSL
jgi:hypothetical protein